MNSNSVLASNKWKLFADNLDRSWSILSQDDFEVANIKNKWRSQEENKRNATLIAAAPEMLEALIEINKWCEVNFPRHGNNNEFGTCETFNRVRSAIKKATI